MVPFLLVLLVSAVHAQEDNTTATPACPRALCGTALPCPPATPYACTAGPASGGCSPDPWPLAACTEFCNVFSCAFTCSEVCAPSVCAAAPLPCGSTASWMCTNGSSVSSCSAKKAFWPGTGSCRACCDVTSCGVAPPRGVGVVGRVPHAPPTPGTPPPTPRTARWTGCL